ncbi:MAG: FeoB small GTPase domain-containing protein [Dethiobacteria bacterium]|jgi:ferrous iron transport protein B
MKKIVLVGNPNIGKSVIFSQLTGARVMISNYPGTTVEFTRGELKIDTETYEILDAPGTYSLNPTCRAEEVTRDLVEQADIIVNVVNATNLERNLYLTLQLLEREVPMIVVLNMVDEAAYKGIVIDVQKLEELLEVPVVATVAISGEGLTDLLRALPAAKAVNREPLANAQRWSEVGSLVGEVQKVSHRHRTWLEALQDASLRPLTGLPLAALIMYLTFKVVIGVGEYLHEDFFDAIIFERFYRPLITNVSIFLGDGFWHDILIGSLIDGEISFTESLGMLTTGIFVSFGLVLPFLVIFYLALGFLEDSGYLPRLAVMLDRLMHRIGLHGYGIVPMILGLGCNVPAALAARNLESRRERFIACTIMAVAIPCIAQIALIFGLVGRYGGEYLALIFAVLFFIWAVLGLLIDRVMPGYTPSMVIEIPPYRLPHLKSQLKKVGMRLKHFISHAVPYILGGIFFINLLYAVGVIQYLAAIFAPVVEGLLGLPEEAVSALLIGFLRKDMAVAMLEPLNLTAAQFVTGAVVLVVYFPCAATFSVLVRELGIRDMFASAAIMIATAVVAGTALNLLLGQYFSAALLSIIFVALGIFLIVVAGGTSDRRELNDGWIHPAPGSSKEG